MKLKKTFGVTAAAVTAAVVVGGTAASAGTATPYLFVGWAGGSIVRALDNTVTSDLTAASSINNQGLVSDTNDAANIHIDSLLDAGVVHTSAASSAIPGGYQVRSEAETTNINAFGGLVTADAIDTVTIARVVNGVASTDVHTTFVNLTVGSTHVPVNVAPNTIIRIPNVITVGLNWQAAAAHNDSAFTMAMGAYVSLLKPFGSNAVGASVSISPATSQLGPVVIPPSGHFLQAKAYGTKVTAQVGSLAGIRSDPTAPIAMPAAGTNGDVKVSNIAGVNLNPLASVGAVRDTVYGTNTVDGYDAKATSDIAKVNLLDGFIKADAVGSFARVHGTANGTPVVTGGSTLVTLVINGNPITLDASPNTVINIPNVLKVTLNQQVRTANSILVRALDIQLLAAKSGFPAGAEIEVAVSRVSVH
jgi:hypothetical protein